VRRWPSQSRKSRAAIRTGVVALGRDGTAALTVVSEESDPNATNGSAAGLSLPDEIVRGAARSMLATALRAEVAACVKPFRDEVIERAGDSGGDAQAA
jgi:hypothetical protein